jgi:hypothetical protein
MTTDGRFNESALTMFPCKFCVTQQALWKSLEDDHEYLPRLATPPGSIVNRRYGNIWHERKGGKRSAFSIAIFVVM